MASVTTTTIITFFIVAALALGILRFCIFTRAPIRIALSNLRASCDSGYALRREEERERVRILELEAQQVAVAAHAARTRVWYGYRFPEVDNQTTTARYQHGGSAVPVRGLPAMNITLTASEVDSNFPSKLYKLQETVNYNITLRKASQEKINFSAAPIVNTPMPEKEKKDSVTTNTVDKSTLIASMGEDTDIPDNACIVCLEEMVDTDNTKLLTCGHIYHGACITEWMVCHKAVCPLCRYDYSQLHKNVDADLASTSS